jgi:hypothetical protein
MEERRRCDVADITAVIGLVDADAADETVEALMANGLTDDEIDVRTPTPGRYRLADELLHAEATSAAHGAMMGLVVGALVGIGPALVFTDTPNVAMLMAVLGGALGILVGGMAGLLANEQPDDDPVEFREIGPDAQERVIEVHSLHWRGRAHKVLERHGAEFLSSGRPATG